MKWEKVNSQIITNYDIKFTTVKSENNKVINI